MMRCDRHSLGLWYRLPFSEHPPIPSLVPVDIMPTCVEFLRNAAFRLWYQAMTQMIPYSQTVRLRLKVSSKVRKLSATKRLASVAHSSLDRESSNGLL